MTDSAHWCKTKPVFLHSVRNSRLKVLNLLGLFGKIKQFIAMIVFPNIILLFHITTFTDALLLSISHLSYASPLRNWQIEYHFDSLWTLLNFNIVLTSTPPLQCQNVYTVFLHLVSHFLSVLPYNQKINGQLSILRLRLINDVTLFKHLYVPPPQATNSLTVIGICDCKRCPTQCSCYTVGSVLCQAQNPHRSLGFWISNHT